MTSHALDSNLPPADHLPTLTELGRDLLHVSAPRRVLTIASPFLAMLSYTISALMGFWLCALVSVMYLSFITYGSSCHDLVHQTLGLRRQWNHFWLSLIELLSFRSGTAYRLSHLHHHRHLLETCDVEGAAAHMSLFGAILTGPTLQLELWLWAMKNFASHRSVLLLEGVGVSLLFIVSVVAAKWTWVPLIYAGLVIAGSWAFPLVTVYIPHVGDGHSALTQTRLFRGGWSRLLAMDHLYHLEHHLYPAVPHHHWRSLAIRLDPYLEELGIAPSTGRRTD